MATNMKKAVLKKQIEGIVYEVMLKTTAEMVTVDDAGTTLAAKLIELGQLPTNTYVDEKIAALVNGSPETLDTLNELAAALGSDPNFATTIATQMGNKVDKVDGKGLSTNDYTTEEKTKLAGVEEGANKTTIANNLTTTAAGSALDAAQGKVLNDKIVAHTGDAVAHVTAEERAAWNARRQFPIATIEKGVLMQMRQGANLYLLYPATLAENVIGLEGVAMEVSRSQVSIPAADWLLNVDGLYVCSVALSGVTTEHDVDVIILPTSKSAAALMGGTISSGSVTLISSTLPEDTMDVMFKVKQPYAADNVTGVVAVLNARGPMGAVYV